MEVEIHVEGLSMYDGDPIQESDMSEIVGALIEREMLTNDLDMIAKAVTDKKRVRFITRFKAKIVADICGNEMWQRLAREFTMLVRTDDGYLKQPEAIEYKGVTH